MDKFIIQKIYQKNDGLYEDKINLSKNDMKAIFQCCQYGLMLQNTELLNKIEKLIGER